MRSPTAGRALNSRNQRVAELLTRAARPLASSLRGSVEDIVESAHEIAIADQADLLDVLARILTDDEMVNVDAAAWLGVVVPFAAEKGDRWEPDEAYLRRWSREHRFLAP